MSEIRTPLIYALHSGNLYGTERMALATAAGLRDEFAPVIFAPPGQALGAAAELGFATRAFNGPREFAKQLWPLLRQHPRVAFVATGVMQSLVFTALNRFARCTASHLHVVHGGTDEALSYGRKRWLQPLGAQLVAVSDFVKTRLAAHGVQPQNVTVIENFLADTQLARPQRTAFSEPGVRRAIVISRLDPIKRVDLLLDALDQEPRLAGLDIQIFGSGGQRDVLQARAAGRHPNVRFAGFSSEIAAELSAADLLIHTCPEEPFGLAIIEAMAARVPVLSPDAGGAGSLIEPGVSGLHFNANDARDLAQQLLMLQQAPAAFLNALVDGGTQALQNRFAAKARVADYRRMLQTDCR